MTRGFDEAGIRRRVGKDLVDCMVMRGDRRLRGGKRMPRHQRVPNSMLANRPRKSLDPRRAATKRDAPEAYLHRAPDGAFLPRGWVRVLEGAKPSRIRGYSMIARIMRPMLTARRSSPVLGPQGAAWPFPLRPWRPAKRSRPRRSTRRSKGVHAVAESRAGAPITLRALTRSPERASIRSSLRASTNLSSASITGTFANGAARSRKSHQQ